MKDLEQKQDGNYTRILCAVSNKPWKQHPLKQQIYSHLPDIGLMSKVFANCLGDWCSIPDSKTQKMVLDATLLNTQHYKVRIKGKAIQGME